MGYTQEYVRCGKNCASCPHGPYWYYYWRVGKRLHKKYVGKERPQGAGPGRPKSSVTQEHPHDLIFNRKTASRDLAYTILGLSPGVAWDSVLSAYRRLARTAHPDRGGETVVMQRVVSAYSYLRAVYGR